MTHQVHLTRKKQETRLTVHARASAGLFFGLSLGELLACGFRQKLVFVLELTTLINQRLSVPF